MPHHDLAIIGTGSGNSILDPRFADWDVAIIERDRFGGTCLNVGCIPTKMFVHTADLAAVPALSAKLGVDEQLTAVRWAYIRDRIFGRIDPIAAGGREYRLEHADNAKVTVYEGQARFVGERRLAGSLHSGGTPETVTADRIVLASGGRPRVPDVPGLAEVGFHTSDTVMRLESLPARMIIIGSGLVAAEFAHVFSSFGVDITMIAPLRCAVAPRGHRHQCPVHRARRRQVGCSAQPHRVACLAQREWRAAAPRRPGRTRVGRGRRTAGGGRPPAQLRPAARRRRRDRARRRLLPAGRPVPADHGRRDLGAGRHLLTARAQARGQPRGSGRPAMCQYRPPAGGPPPPAAAPGRADRRRPPVRAARGVHLAADRLGRAHRAGGGAARRAVRHGHTGLRRHRARLGHGGHHRVRQAARRPVLGFLLGAHIIGPQASSLLQPVIQAMSFGLDARTMARGLYWIHPALPELVENALLNLPLGASPCPT